MSNDSSSVSIVLITGAARRIGAAIARRFHSEDCHVILHYNRSRVEALALCDSLNAVRTGSALALQADLCDMAAVARLAEQALLWHGKLNTLINNASSFYATEFGTVTQAQWDDLLGSNLKGAFFLSQALAPALRASQGSIINLSDTHADNGLHRHAPYSIAKAGIGMMTKVLARELAPQVRVNAIAPGAILWPEKGTQDTFTTAQSQQRIVDSIALRHTGRVGDIADAAWFLAHTASYMSGQTLRVDGGRKPVNSL